MTSLLLSDEDRAVLDSLRPVVQRKLGVATNAAVIRYALRLVVADHERRAARRMRRKRAPVDPGAGASKMGLRGPALRYGT